MNKYKEYWDLACSASAINSCGEAKSALLSAKWSETEQSKENHLRYALGHLDRARDEILQELNISK